MLETRVQDLLEAPDAKLVIERAQAILADEAGRRRAFREWLRLFLLLNAVSLYAEQRHQFIKATKLPNFL